MEKTNKQTNKQEERNACQTSWENAPTHSLS